MKKIFAMVLCFCMFAMSANAASLQFTIGSTQVLTVADDKPLTEVTLETAPFTVDGRTMVPVRVIAENFGALVGWDEATKTVTISSEDTDIQLVLGSTAAIVNGKEVTLDVAPMEQNGRTLVPLRFVTETFGYNVKYVPSVEQIYITDSPVVLRGSQSFLTFEELKSQYDLLKDARVPKAEDGATSAEIINAKGDLLAEIFDSYLMNAAVYDYVMMLPSGEKTQYWKEYAAMRSASVEANAVKNGALPVAWHSYYETAYVANAHAITVMADVPKEEMQAAYERDYICAKHILIPAPKIGEIPLADIANGVTPEDREREATEAKQFADDLYVQIETGADFDALMHQYSEDPGLVAYPNGYVFTKGEMVDAFYNGAASLQIGEVGAPVRSEHGYHIIKREPLPEISAELEESYRQDRLLEFLVPILSAYKFYIDMDLYDLLYML